VTQKNLSVYLFLPGLEEQNILAGMLLVRENIVEGKSLFMCAVL
jgi:hypothetical protein